MWLTPEARKKSASFLLFHGMNDYYLNQKKLKFVSGGTKSISHKTNIQDFLQKRFLFRKAYSQMNVAYAFPLGLFVSVLSAFRSFFQDNRLNLFQKIGVLLEQEHIRRQCNSKN